MQDGDDVHAEVEKVEVEKSVKKPRKPMSEESLLRLAKAREKANRVRKQLAEERKAERENLVEQKMKEVEESRKVKQETAAEKEAEKRVRKKRESIIIERSSDSDSSSEDDIRDARVYTVRKTRSKEPEQMPSIPAKPVQDPLAGMYHQYFSGTQSIF